MDNELNLNINRNIDNVEEFKFNLPPIKGFPELRWAGKRPFRSTRYYPAQLKENHGEPVNGWMNEIFWGDNLQVMSHLLKKYRGQVKLIYIDPPFDSKADYKKKIQLKGQAITNDQNAFEEKQYTDIWTNDEYLQFMYERLILIRELLSDDGCIYVHTDHRVNSYIRVIMDEVFGLNQFKSLITWKRTSAHNDTGKFGANSDYILFYSKSNNITWNQQYEPYDEKYLARFKRTDEKGRRWTDGPLTAKGLSGGGYEYEYKGVNGFWRCPLATMEQLDKDDLLYFTKNGGIRIKRFLDENKGIPLQSCWTDVFPVNSQATEREGYPTQKPEELISRIILTSSDPGDLVFDCFMGSGTTQAVAMKSGRRFLGADINLGSIQTTTKRLLKISEELKDKEAIYSGFSVYNVNNYDIFRNPVQAKELLLEALEIQKLPGNNVFDGEKDGRLVKIMPVNRISSKADLNDLIANIDQRVYEKRQSEYPNKPAEYITLVCMGHDPDLGPTLQNEIPFKLDIEVVDILRDRTDIQFKRDSEADICISGSKLEVKSFYPMNLLQKLSQEKENVEDWREMVESIMIDFNYDGSVFEPNLVDIPQKKELVVGRYDIPEDAGTIKIKITDLLSESYEEEVIYG